MKRRVSKHRYWLMSLAMVHREKFPWRERRAVMFRHRGFR